MIGAGRRTLPRVAALIVGLFVTAAADSGSAAEPSRGELASRTAFRVCADPDNLPFSNQQGEGFENRIAELFAGRLGLPLAYTWHPQTLGFIRNTLAAYRCDVVIGMSAGHELVQNTRSYYRSVYVLVYRAVDRERFASLDSPLVPVARIGVVANTPPATLVQRRGLIANVRSYGLVVDTRVEHPARQAIEDLAAGEIDMALIWGPIAGYWAARSPVPLEWVPLEGDRRINLPMDFRISMGVRHGETEWLGTLNHLIRELERDIEAILIDYDVPLLDRRGRLINPPPWLRSAADHQGSLFEDGYRIAEYRAPIGPPPEGVIAVGTQQAHELIERGDVIPLDVLPAPRPTDTPGAGSVRIPPAHESIPGAVWLPNVGLGVLPDDTRRYLADALASLRRTHPDLAPLVFCKRDCWMSWNAARRLRREFSIERVYWYPDGTDGWQEAGLPTVEVRPFEPGPSPD